MAKVKVKVLNAVVDGHKKGEEISIEERSAAHLEKIGYVERVAGKTSGTSSNKSDTKSEKGGE